MKKLYYILIVSALALISACEKPQYVEPTAERQGITSLTAYFTMGKYADKELAKLVVENPDMDRYVIPVPWFYPEESEDGTTIHMTRARVRAELAPDCTIEPSLTILDLTQENKFVYTNAQGESRDIIITGIRKKSSKANAMSFTLTEPYPVEGFVNDEKGEIYLFTTDDLTGFKASAVPCAHATVKTDLSQPKNYNDPQTVTLVAHDGTERTYNILKKYPTKIPYGFRDGSVRQLFNIDPVTRLEFPGHKTPVYPSLASVEGKLVVALGYGHIPVYLNGLTGVKEGTVNTGTAVVDAVSNDQGGNLLYITNAPASEKCMIYRTKSVTEAPVLFHSFDNDTDVAVGHHVRVHGNIDADAVILLSHEGVSGVTETSKITRVVITGGVVASTEVLDLSGLGLSWGETSYWGVKAVPVSTNPADGLMLSYYTPNILSYVNGNMKIASQLDMADLGASGNYGTNCLDAKTYNNALYLVSLISGHFPQWGAGPMLNIFDIGSPTSIKDGKPIVTTNADGAEIEWFQKADQGVSAADVVMAPSGDGFKVFIYYYDHNCGVIGGYSADCIDMSAV